MTNFTEVAAAALLSFNFISYASAGENAALKSAGLSLEDTAIPEVPAKKAPHAPAAVSNLQGGTLTIYSYPPRNILDWSSPKEAMADFAGTTLGQYLHSDTVDFVSDFGEDGSVPQSYRSPMGHTLAHVQCALPDGAAYDSWTSFSGQDLREVDKDNLINKKLGLGVLFYDYIDGHIISGIENKMFLIYYDGKNGNLPRYWQQNIDAKTCGSVRDMNEFFKSFHFPKGSTLEALQARPPQQILYYSSNMDPYEGYLARRQGRETKIGGGCAPYGLGLLKAAGKYDYMLDDILTLRLDVSERLIGGIPDETGRIREVSISELTGGLGENWTYPGYKNRKFKNYDPYRIWRFIGGVNACLTGNAGNCPPEASAWLSARQGHVSAGPAQVMSDTIKVKSAAGASHVQPDKKITHTVRVQGIIVD
ncbi:MAG: hypothetical protein NTX59_13960 [Elusimicrobia bacterium]|nr:hypothetical protein [Elusimicrobiota bacterium]